MIYLNGNIKNILINVLQFKAESQNPPVTKMDLDQVIFFIYPDINVLKEKYPSCIHSKDLLNASLQEIREFLSRQEDYKEYFWHDEGIHWEMMEMSSHPFISGKIKFGDGMEDEWFILKLLLRLSSKDCSLIISIFDTDGDFVLIEAAEVLPEWLEPETSKNRVFIHEGSIKIIPIDAKRDQVQLHEAFKLIREGKVDSKLTERIMKVIEAKLLEEQKLHKAKLLIPIEVAKVLKAKKQLIGPAVSAFYNRESDAMLKHLSRFKDQPTLLTTVPMTRIQFAQLACQEIEGLSQPSSDNPIAAELGLKLTFGFDILLSSEAKYIEKYGDSIISVQAEVEAIISNKSNDNIDSYINNEPEDSLDWMEIDETILDSDLQTKLEQLTMTEMEQSELIETWTNEFEGTKSSGEKLKDGISEIDEIVEKMKKMIESSSNFEGIEGIEGADSDTDFDDDSDFDSSFNSENDEELIEREIFETINFDPDLLMKIVDANAQAGVSNEEFLARFRKYQSENPSSAPTNAKPKKQKGLADIDQVKVDEARKSSRKPIEPEVDENDVETESDFDEKAIDGQAVESELESEEEEVTDEFIYGQTFDQLKHRSNSIVSESESDEDIPENVSINDYYSAMDKELSSVLKTSEADTKLPADLEDTELETNLGKNLIESMAAGRGSASITPIETVVSGLGKKIPRPNI